MKELRVKNSLKKALVDDEDYDKLKLYTWFKNNGGALVTTTNYEVLSMPRMIYNNRLMYDHKDNDPFNNQKENLRVATYSQNNQNRSKIKSKTSSKYKGVTWNKQLQRWRAQIYVNNKTKSLGFFIKEDEAALAYNRAALKYFKEFARLNVIE